MRISQVIAAGELSLLPSPSRFFRGVVTLRNAAIPVLDLRQRFNMAVRPDSEAGQLVVVKLPQRQIALAVDEVLEIFSVPGNRIMPPPDLEGPGAECILGVCHYRDCVIMVIDIDRLSVEQTAFSGHQGSP